MKITYKTKTIEKVCTDVRTAERKHGSKMAEKIGQRLDEIRAADTVETMVRFRIGRCHPLTGDRNGQFAVDLVHPYRLVFEKNGEEIQIEMCIRDRSLSSADWGEAGSWDLMVALAEQRLSGC